jgi:hypothetical protein
MNAVLTSWNETLASLPPSSRLATDRKTIDALMDASAAFAILAVISDFFWMCIPPIMPLCFLISGITGLISSACALGARWAAVYRSLADKDTTALNGSPALVMVPALMHFPFFWLMCKAFENRKRKWMQPDGRWRIPGRHYTAADTNRRMAITGTDLPNATTVSAQTSTASFHTAAESLHITTTVSPEKTAGSAQKTNGTCQTVDGKSQTTTVPSGTTTDANGGGTTTESAGTTAAQTCPLTPPEGGWIDRPRTPLDSTTGGGK